MYRFTEYFLQFYNHNEASFEQVAKDEKHQQWQQSFLKSYCGNCTQISHAVSISCHFNTTQA